MTSVGEDLRVPLHAWRGKGFSASRRLLGVDLRGKLQDHFEGDHFPWESEGDAGLILQDGRYLLPLRWILSTDGSVGRHHDLRG